MASAGCRKPKADPMAKRTPGIPGPSACHEPDVPDVLLVRQASLGEEEAM